MFKRDILNVDDNYIEVQDGLFYTWFIYTDAKGENSLIDSLLYRDNIRITGCQCFTKAEEEYDIISCKVKKKDKEAFKRVLKELKSKALLCGKVNYIDESKRLIDFTLSGLVKLKIGD